MASHFWKVPPRTLEDSLVQLVGYFFVGAAGVPSTTFPTKTLKGVINVTRTGVGAYAIQLDDKYADVLYIDATPVSASSQDIIFEAVSYSVTSNTTANPPVINVRFLSSATPTDLTTGTQVMLDIKLKNSTTN